VLGTTGCNLNQAAISSSTATPAARTLQGRVYGGQNPVVGGHVYLYAAGTSGYGTGATSLLNSSVASNNSGYNGHDSNGYYVITDSNGDFTITGDYTITPPSNLYIVATGGNSGGGNNPDIVLMAAIGGCAATTTTTLSSSLFININEITTAAAVLEFASNVQTTPFMAAPAAGNVGAPNIGAPVADYNDLRTAFENVSNLVDISTGDVVNPTGSKGKLIYTLADILAYCVNSNSSNCSNLLSDATHSGYTAADTVQAAWYIAQNPTNNNSNLFNLISGSNPPFTALSSAPTSFAVSAPTDFVACFAVLGNSAVANTGSTVVSGGDLGIYPITGAAVTGFTFSSTSGPGIVTGAPATVHLTDSVAENAQTDLTAAYTYAAGLSSTDDLTGHDLGSLGAPLTPGVYKFTATAGLTGTLSLDAQNNPDALFTFQIGSTLTTAASSQVSLINGAQAQNVFWQVGSSATIGGSFAGTIMAHDSITLGTGVSLSGRALASGAAVTLNDNPVTAP